MLESQHGVISVTDDNQVAGRMMFSPVPYPQVKESGRMQAQCWLATGSRSYRPLIGNTPVPQSAPQPVSYILLYQ